MAIQKNNGLPFLYTEDGKKIVGWKNPDDTEAQVPAADYFPFEKFGVKPIGFNYYSLVTEIIYGVSNLATIRPANLNYIRATGANLVRVAFSGFSAADYTTRIHTNGTVPDSVTPANLKPSFVAACDTAMDALAAYGLKAHANIVWGQTTLPGVFSEAVTVAYGSTASKTFGYTKSFAEWFVNRYRNHAAFCFMSIGNEYVTDNAGVTNPTPAQLGTWFAGIARAIKAVKPDCLVTADVSSPPVSLSRTKETLEQAVARFRTLYAGLDAYSIHIYNDDYSFTGHQAAEAISVAQNIYYSPLGYEGVESLMQAYSDMAAADGKPLIVGEFGINEGNEISDPANTTWVNIRKKWRLFSAVAPYADCSLVWNVQDTVQAGTAGNQNIWCIDPASSTNRPTDFSLIASAFNVGRVSKRGVGGGLSGRKRQQAPAVALRMDGRTAGQHLRFTTTSAHASSSGYSIAFWVRLDALLNNAETMMDFRGAGNVSGFILLALLVSNAKSFYIDGRYASGSAGNTNNTLPDFELKDWNHICYNTVTKVINGTTVYYIEIWLNGVYWQSVNATAGLAAIPNGTVVYPFGNSANGVPMRMQDIALFPSGLLPNEIWAHMRGETNARALTHIRAFEDGTFSDISKNAVALTSSQVTVTVEK